MAITVKYGDDGTVTITPDTPPLNLLSTLSTLGINQGIIMAQNDQILADVQAVSDQLVAAKDTLGKIGTETTGLLAAAAGQAAALAALQAALDAAVAAGSGAADPAVAAAVAALRVQAEAVVAAATAVDNLVPDAPLVP